LVYSIFGFDYRLLVYTIRKRLYNVLVYNVPVHTMCLYTMCLYTQYACIQCACTYNVPAGLHPTDYLGDSLGNTAVQPPLKLHKAWGIELMITFVLVFTVFASCDKKRTDLGGSIPLTIGLSVTLCHLFAVCRNNIKQRFIAAPV